MIDWTVYERLSWLFNSLAPSPALAEDIMGLPQRLGEDIQLLKALQVFAPLNSHLDDFFHTLYCHIFLISLVFWARRRARVV